MNVIIYFITYTIAGTLSARPMIGTKCWEMIGDCGWAKKQAICAETYGNAAEYLQQNKLRCRLGVEKTYASMSSCADERTKP